MNTAFPSDTSQSIHTPLASNTSVPHVPQTLPTGPTGPSGQAPSALAQAGVKPLVDINGLRFSGIFPTGKEPCERTLRRWTKGRVIPSHRVGRFVYYDLDEVARHIHVKRLVPAR